MGYAAFSVVYGEQPSAAKWNILGTNDASFHDGTGIDDGVILARHIGEGEVGPEKLGTGTILLDHKIKSANQGSITTEVAISDLSSTVTIPPGGRSVELNIIGRIQSTVSGDLIAFLIKEDGTTIGSFYHRSGAVNTNETVASYAFSNSPSNGSHTYTITCQRLSGTGTVTISASGVDPWNMIVKLV